MTAADLRRGKLRRLHHESFDLLVIGGGINGAGIAREAAFEPRLRAEGLVGGALYHDCFTDDARLVLENVLGAAQAGAICLNYAGVESFERDSAGMLTGATVRDHGDEGGSFLMRTRTV